MVGYGWRLLGNHFAFELFEGGLNQWILIERVLDRFGGCGHDHRRCGLRVVLPWWRRGFLGSLFNQQIKTI